MKKNYIIIILSTLFLFQHSLYPMRLGNIAAATKKRNHHAPVYRKTMPTHNHNKRNQRIILKGNTNQNTTSQPKSKQSLNKVLMPNATVELQDDKKKIIEQPNHNETKNPIELAVIKKEKPLLLPNNDMKKNDSNITSFDQHPKFNNQEEQSIYKKTTGKYNPYDNIKAKSFDSHDTFQDNIKKPQSIASKKKSTFEKEEITDLYVKRLKEFNEQRKTYVDQENDKEKIKMGTQETAYQNKTNDMPIVNNNEEPQNNSEHLQIGQMYANAYDTISNMLSPANKNSEKIETVDNKESIATNNTSNNAKPLTIRNDVQVGEMAANTSNTFTNGLNAVWQYGKDSVKNVWNNCTSYDFWLKPYEMFSQKVIEKDPATSKDVEVVRGNLHALLINQFGNTQSTHAIYYLLRTGMVILGMALFCKPSLITEIGTKKVTVQIASGLMQLVTGGSLASVVGMITGGALKALPAALPFGKAQASVATIASATPKTSWGQWAFGWAKNIGTTSLLNQLWSYKIRKDTALQDVNVQKADDVRLSAEPQPSVKLTENNTETTIEENVNNVIPEKDLENAFNNLANDPKANEDLYKLLLLSSQA